MSLLIAFVMKYYTFARCSRSARIYLTTTQTTSFCPTKLPQTLLYNTQHPNARKFNVVLHRSYLFFSSREKYRYLVFEEDDTICSFGDDDDDDDDDDDRARRRGTRGVREEKARDVGMINLFAAKVRAARATITTRWWCLFNWKRETDENGNET